MGCWKEIGLLVILLLLGDAIQSQIGRLSLPHLQEQFSVAVGPWPCGLLKKLVHWLLPLASHMGLSQTIRRPWKDVQEESVLDIHGV